MKLLKIALTTVAFAGMSSVAVAGDSNLYANIGVELIDAGDVDLPAATVRLGYDFNETFAVEGQLSFGIGDDDFGGADVELDTSFAAFVKAGTGVTENIDLFARIGLFDASFSSNSTLVGDVDSDGFAFGVGAQYSFDDTNGIRLDYTNYDGGDADVFSLAYVRNF